MALNIYKFIYHTVITVWGYYVYYGLDIFPVCLGGIGSFKNTWKNYPYIKRGPMIKEYTLITMGYHFSGVVTLLLETRKTDFIEMSLHHICAVYLYGGTYLFNTYEQVAIVGILHESSDIFIAGLRFFGDTNCESFIP